MPPVLQERRSVTQRKERVTLQTGQGGCWWAGGGEGWRSRYAASALTMLLTIFKPTVRFFGFAAVALAN